MKLIFMGTPSFAVPSLQALHEGGHEIVAVYSQPPRPAGRGQRDTPSPVHIYAQEHGLPVFTPVALKSPEAQAEFAAHKANAAIVAAYGLLLPKAILEACPLGCINVHPSLLPRWRGAAPIQRTIMAGDKETGLCIMQMNEGLDTGDVLLCERFPVPDGMNAGALHDLLAQAAGPLLLKTLQGLNDKKITPMAQPHTGVEYAKKITKEEALLDFLQPASVVRQKILGLSPIPGAYFEHHGERIKIFDCVAGDTALFNVDPGLRRDDKGLYIVCNPGVIYPTELQRPSKKRMRADEFMAGFKL